MSAATSTSKPRSSHHTVVGFAAVVVAALMLVFPSNVGAACNGAEPLISNCRKYVMKAGPVIDPSAACCAAAREADMSCLCSMITQRIASLVSVGKICHLARTCKLPMPPSGSKCGALVVPENC